MDYRELKWGALKSYATKLGINTKGMTKEVLLEWLDAMPDVSHGIEELKSFKGIKEPEILSNEWIESLVNGAKVKFHNRLNPHPLFNEIKDYLPYLKAYKKLNAVSRDPKINKAIATLFVKYIETQKNAKINIGCGRCVNSYYQRMVANYNKLVDQYGTGERI